MHDYLVAQLERNFRERLAHLPSGTTGIQVYRQSGCWSALSGLPPDMFNLAFVWGPAGAEPLAEAVDRFRRQDAAWAVWCGPSGRAVLEAQGARLRLRPSEEALGMVLSLAELKPADLPPGVRVEAVERPEQLRDFARVLAELSEPADPQVIAYFALTARVALAGRPLALYVAYAGERAVGTCEVFHTGSVAGIYSVATAGSWRRRGIAAAITVHAAHQAHREGASLAVLEASPPADSVYRRIGFRPLAPMAVYRPAAT